MKPRLLTALWLVTPAVASSQAATQWTVSVEQRYGSAGAELMDPRTLAVDGAGRLYVGDMKPAAVKVFTPDGKLLRIIGQEGGGPGEYRNPWIAARGAHLVVHDPTQSRTTLFDTAGKVVRSWQTFCCHQNEIALDDAGRVVIPASLGPAGAGRRPYVRYSLDGKAIDTLFIGASGPEKLWTVARQGTDGKPSGGSTSMVVPFTPGQQFAWDPQGGFVSGWSATLSLYRRRTMRDSTPLLSANERARPIAASTRQERVDSAVAAFAPMVGAAAARAAVRAIDIPTNFPAFGRLFVDEARNIWAQVSGADEPQTTFRVFSATGADLGRATIPLRLPDWGGVAFGVDRMFVRTESGDGEPQVVRLLVRRSR